MRPTDRLSAMLMHATARFTVRYGDDLRFAGRDLPKPQRISVATRHGDVRAWVYAGPLAEDRPAHVHFHGGAWLMRYPQMDDWWCRYLAAEAGVTVVNVDFRTGPYVTYPVAQHQCHDVSAWVAERVARISVVAVSLKNGLAASVCLQARDAATFAPALQVLAIPALDLVSEGGGPGMISPGLRALVRRVYFPDPSTRAEPYASPLLAPDLRALPPAIVLTAERDTLRRDGDDYARRLRGAGVPVIHDVTPDADHYFLTEDPARARTTMAMVAGEVRTRLLDI